MQSENLLKCKEVVSVAVKIGKDTTLYKLNQGLPLQIIIKQLCEEGNIDYVPNYYALQITDTKEGNINKYVTEDNRMLYITDGSELRLIYSASEMCKMIYEKICTEEELVWTLEKFSTLSKDKTFSEEFITNHGISAIVSFIEKSQPPYDVVHLCLDVLLSFYNLNLITNFESIPVDILISFVTISNNVPERVIEYSLHFLKKILVSKKVSIYITKYIRNKIYIDDIIKYFHTKNNPGLQEKALAYLNTLLINSEINDHLIITHLETMKVRETIWKNIVMNVVVTPELAHELYVFQSVILKHLTEKLNSYIDTNSDAAAHLQELHNISSAYENYKRDSIVSYFEEYSSDNVSSDVYIKRPSDYESDNLSEKHMLSIQRSASIVESENEEDINYNCCRSQPSNINLLTLSCMQYFCHKKLKTFTKIKLMEEKVQKKPFHIICDHLVHLLCDALQVDGKLVDGCRCYQPLIFEATKESPFFEELFCRVAVRLSLTSKEMKARTPQDHDKVINVLHHQVTSVLDKQLQSWRKFEEELQNITYEKVVESWQSQNDENLLKLQDLSAVIGFRENLRPTVEELVSKHRLHLLCQGTKFLKTNSRSQKLKKKFWFIYLSPNYTVFHYGDCGESEDNVCFSKLSVSNIKELVVGRKCPHVREAKNNRKLEPEFPFSIILDQEEPSSLDFIAPSQKSYDYWTDGLCFLLGTKMRSKSMENELKSLLDMEVRLHLLDLEGIDIPQDSPNVPADPSYFHNLENLI